MTVASKVLKCVRLHKVQKLHRLAYVLLVILGTRKKKYIYEYILLKIKWKDIS